MFGRIARLPIRAARRIIDLLDGERSAPSPAPSVEPTAVRSAPVVATTTASAGDTRTPTPEPKSESDVTVKVEETPNPNAMKFTLSVTVCETGSFSFNASDDAVVHSMAKAILGLDGVRSVFGVRDFITVTRDEQFDWADLEPRVVSAIQSASTGS